MPHRGIIKSREVEQMATTKKATKPAAKKTTKPAKKPAAKTVRGGVTKKAMTVGGCCPTITTTARK
jgi:hypothetical protein